MQSFFPFMVVHVCQEIIINYTNTNIQDTTCSGDQLFHFWYFVKKHNGTHQNTETSWHICCFYSCIEQPQNILTIDYFRNLTVKEGHFYTFISPLWGIMGDKKTNHMEHILKVVAWHFPDNVKIKSPTWHVSQWLLLNLFLYQFARNAVRTF